MPRQPRNTYEGAFVHVNTRGNDRQGVYFDRADRLAFLQIFDRLQSKYEWVVYAWVLMTNHYHFVMQIPRDGLSAGMRDLNGGFARWANQRRGRTDHLFGRRFFSREIVTDAHLLEACRYVVLNPVRAGLCKHPADWAWSSYRACAGICEPEPFLAPSAAHDLIESEFGTEKSKRFDAYRNFVLAGLEPTWPGANAVPGTVRRVPLYARDSTSTSRGPRSKT